jgi:cysteine-rich repeat protein
MALCLLVAGREASGELGTQALGRQGVEMQAVGMQGVGAQALGRQALGRQALGRQALGRQAIGLQGLGVQATGLQALGRQALGRQALGRQALGRQALGRQALGRQALGRQAVGLQGLGLQALGRQALGRQGVALQALGRQGIGLQGIGLQGLGLQALGRQALGRQGIGLAGTALRGIDRVGLVLADVEMGRLRLAEVQLADGVAAQGLQVRGELPLADYRGLQDGVSLRAGPDDGADGTFICVPDGAGGCAETAGTFWVLELKDVPDPEASEVPPSGTDAASGDHGLLLYIAAVEQDTTQNQSKYSDNHDIWLYTVYYRHPGTAQWESLCPKDIYGREHAMAIPTDYYARDDGARKNITFACTAGGVAAKCPRIWGYKPWKKVIEHVWNGEEHATKEIDLKDFYNACVIAARADYCQEDVSFTRSGTTVDLFDRLDSNNPLDSGNSLVSSAGVAYAPGAAGVMLHDEYQISVERNVADLLTSDQLASLSPQQRDLVDRLLASGLQSSRYPDLDPGRDCQAAPYIDRCDPKEPYACYRADNMPAERYGAFIAINSPRHCSHSDGVIGEALDPLCNQCVTRVCAVDPTCCGDAGASYYPGSLLWGERCVALRAEVCRSSPNGNLWPAGQAATPPSGEAVDLPRGPLGALLGFVEDGGAWYAEGWACDPDHPGASVSVQLTQGGEIGTLGATKLWTGSADRELIEGWQELVGIECGGGSRHGFKVLLDGVQEGAVFAYGIDLDMPGAPFTLLRGGAKVVPGGAPSAPVVGVLYSGWLEAPETGLFAFQASAGELDLYRVWVNGWLVAADDNYPDPVTPEAAGQESPPPRTSIQLQKGVSYMLRVEHGGNQSDSGFSLRYRRPSSVEFADFDASLLYPLTEHAGNGLKREYFLDGPTGTSVHRSFGEVDHVWALQGDAWYDVARPEPELLADLDGAPSFTAVFEGQVMPPTSGIYSFSAETDGSIEISIEGDPVTSAGEKPLPDESTCGHDICVPGAPISRTCTQGNFCAARICADDPFCCLTTWDARCIERVGPLCAESCSPAISREIFLSAGIKYDIRVEYRHEEGPGGKLRLLWSLPGLAPSVIPKETLFAATDEPLAALGTGVNATWFADAEFVDELAHTIETNLAYQRADLVPRSQLPIGITCGDAGAPNCGTALAPWAPWIRQPRAGAVVEPGNLLVSGGGAVTGGRVRILLDGVPTSTISSNGAGEFSTTLPVSVGSHTISAVSIVEDLASDPSEPIAISVKEHIEPVAPPPDVLLPREGEIIGVPVMPYSLRGSTEAVLYVRIDNGPPQLLAELVAGTTTTSGTLSLPVGSHTLSFYQELDGSRSPAVSRRVGVRPPELMITNPGDGTSTSGPLEIRGHGADPDFGVVVLADGDGRYFEPLAAASFLPNRDGTFSGTVALDPGRHLLKAYQSVGGVAGDMAPVEVVVVPASTVSITSPTSGEDVQSRLLVSGTAAPRVGGMGTAQRTHVRVYSNGRKVAETPVDDQGNWEVDTWLHTSGAQRLTATQLVPSFSGAGVAESAPSAPVHVYVIPPAPTIASPRTGSVLFDLSLAVRGRALPGALVQVLANGQPAASVHATAAGDFTTDNFTLPKGTHVLTATQAIGGGSQGRSSARVIVSLGDITAPIFCDPSPNASCGPASPPPPRDIRVVASSVLEPEEVSFSHRVAAVDARDGAVAVECVPPSGSAFYVGATVVSCQASDSAQNIGHTSFVVTVESPEPPRLTASDLVVEAESPAGAVVNYQVSAYGSVADCSPPGLGEIQPCSRWEPANGGLGFAPVAMASDPVDAGTLYAALSSQHPVYATLAPVGTRLLKKASGAETWEPVSRLQVEANGLLVARDESRSLYLTHASGIEKSVDGGATWRSCFPTGQVSGLAGASINELRPERLVVWGQDGLGERFALLSEDACTTWRPLGVTGAGSGDLRPGERPLYVAEDPTSDPVAPVFYLSGALESDLPEQPISTEGPTRIHKKIGNRSWRLSPVPPDGHPSSSTANFIYVAPVKNERGHATVITSTAVTRDGGRTWSTWEAPSLRSIVRTSAGLYGVGIVTVVSSDDGLTWSPASSDWLRLEQVVQGAAPLDPAKPPILYAREFFGGIVRSQDGGVSWQRLQFPGLAVEHGFIQAVRADPVDPRVAYTIKPLDGVFQTTDGGRHWTPLRQGLESVGVSGLFSREISVDPFARSTLFLAGAAVWKSLNFGQQWTRVSPGWYESPEGSFAPNPYVPGEAFHFPWDQGEFFVTTDSGANWQSPFPAECSAFNIALNTEGSGVPYAWESDTDFDSSWSLIDGEANYSDGDGGITSIEELQLPTVGKPQLTVTFEGDASFDQVTVWHHTKNELPGSNIPASVTLEYYSDADGTWRPIEASQLSRSYESSTFEESPEPEPISTADQYTFPPVSGSKVRWSFDPQSRNLRDLGGAGVVSLASGENHTCVALSDGRVACWGDASRFSSHESPESAPRLIYGIDDAVKVTAGLAHTCALRRNQRVVCWGSDSDGQLGNNDSLEDVFQPTPVLSLSNVTDIDAGALHTCAAVQGGAAKCWGRNADGQLGDGSTVARPTPVGVDAPELVQLSAGSSHTCGVTVDGQVYCWGSGVYGATGTLVSSPTPIVVPMNDVEEVTAGERHSCALFASGDVSCWGYDAALEVSNPIPSPVPGVTNAYSINAGKFHTCAVQNDPNELVCWGLGTGGQLGNTPLSCGNGVLDSGEECDDGNDLFNDTCPNTCVTSRFASSVPVTVTNLGRVAEIEDGSWRNSPLSAGEAHTCALLQNGRVSCWGAGGLGQLGVGTFTGYAASSGRPTKAVVGLGGGELNAAIGTGTIGTGSSHSCAAQSGGEVVCWGDGTFGQLGDGRSVSSAVPVRAGSLNSVDKVVAGHRHSCALADGELYCWGAIANADDGLSALSSSEPYLVQGIGAVTQLAAGGYTTCAIDEGGQAHCWGDGESGQLGNGFAADSLAPVTVNLPLPASDVSVGYSHACAVVGVSGGAVYCWGAAGNEGLGIPGVNQTATPLAVPGIDDAVAVAAGVDYTCALRGTGDVWCWGDVFNGQLGHGVQGRSSIPVQVLGLDDAMSLSAGLHHTCAVRSTGELACWGDGQEGALGYVPPAPGFSLSATPVPGLSNIIAVGTGFETTCALDSSGRVRCWGNDGGVGATGTGTALGTAAPVPVVAEPQSTLGSAISASAGSFHSCAVEQNGEAYCWGSNAYGQLANDDLAYASTPVAVPLGLSASAVASGHLHTCALMVGGSVSCWGFNGYGQLGSGSTVRGPVTVNALTDAIQVAAGNSHTCALRGTGEVVCWGSGSSGQLGNGQFTDSNSPVTVQGLVDAVTVSAGDYHSCATRQTGEIVCWGSNVFGQLGIGSTEDASVPVAVPLPLPGVTALDVAAGGARTCILLQGGFVACAGLATSAFRDYASGQGLTFRTDAGLVPGVFDATRLASGGLHTCAILENENVVCWGYNAGGQLGDGTRADSTTPVPVVGLTNITQVDSFAGHTCAVNRSGQIFCWGGGSEGQLGDGSIGHHFTPETVLAPIERYRAWVHEIEVRGCSPETPPGQPPQGDALRVDVLPGSPSRLLVSTDLDSSLSFDSGQNWTALNTGASRVVVDKSTSPPTFYVGGAGVAGGDPKMLYRSIDPLGAGFTPVGGHPQMAAFQRFDVDPSGTGAVYAIGDQWSFMVSPDRGATWYPDSQAPPASQITNLWISPVDGAVYTSVLPAGVPVVNAWDEKSPTQGTLWKRSASIGLPPGARVTQSEIRPTCVPVLETGRAVQPGATFPIGETAIRCTATDVFGNTAEREFMVTVQDTIPPRIDIPDDIVVAAPAGGTVDVDFEVTATDAAGSSTEGELDLTCDPPPGPFGVGLHTVSCTATDRGGRSTTASFNVIVSDQHGKPLAPLMLIVPDAVEMEARNQAGAVVPYPVSARSADGTVLSPQCSPPPGSEFPIGRTSVTCSANDAVGTLSRSFPVTVRDSTAPGISVIALPPAAQVGATIRTTASSRAGSIVEFRANANDAVDGGLMPICTPDSGSVFGPGETAVVCRARDRAGNQATTRLEVIVEDNAPPQLELAPIRANASDFTGAIVEFAVTAHDREDGELDQDDIDCIPDSGSWFPIGESQVSCTARDSANNEARGSFAVTVVDNAPPLLDLPDFSPLVLEAAGPQGAPVAFAVSASDRVDGELTPRCERLNEIGLPLAVGSGDLFPLGVWNVRCSASDLSGNVAEGFFEVQVLDTTPPVLSLPDDQILPAESPLGARVSFVVGATDTVSLELPVVCAPAAASVFPMGSTLVSCVTRDQARNEARGSFKVTVRSANQPPTLTVPEAIEVPATGANGAIVAFADHVSASDPEDGTLTPICAPVSGSRFDIGSTQVNCRVTDSGGLFDEKSFPVIVTDPDPIFPPAPELISAFATSTRGARVTYTTPAAVDAAGKPVKVTCSHPSGSQFPVNKTQVTCTAVNSTGRASQKILTVWVTYQAPADGSFFLFPIRPDGSSVFRIGQPLPVRFRLHGASARIRDLKATFRVTKISDDITGTVAGEGDEATEDESNMFKWRLLWYMYRWRTRQQSPGTYLIQADLGDGVEHKVTVSLTNSIR